MILDNMERRVRKVADGLVKDYSFYCRRCRLTRKGDLHNQAVDKRNECERIWRRLAEAITGEDLSSETPYFLN